MSRVGLQRYLETWGAYLQHGIDAFIPYVHPDVVWEEYRLAPGAQVWHGRDGIRGLYRRWEEDFDDFHFEPAGEPVELGDDAFAIRVNLKGRGRASGIEIDWQVFMISTYRDGLLVRGYFADTLDEARQRLRE